MALCRFSQVLEWLVAVTVAFCSEHSPGPGLAVTAFCSGPGLAWLVPMAVAFCSEHSPGPGLAHDARRMVPIVTLE